jgi:hypothetical protein
MIANFGMMQHIRLKEITSLSSCGYSMSICRRVNISPTLQLTRARLFSPFALGHKLIKERRMMLALHTSITGRHKD